MKNIVNKYILGKPQTLGAGVKRAVKKASSNTSLKKVSMLNIEKLGKGNNNVQVREYSNGVTFYENEKGLIVLGINNMQLGNYHDKLYHCYPVMATLRLKSKTGGQIRKFYNSLETIKGINWLKDVFGKKCNITKFTRNRSLADDDIKLLENNRNSMLYNIA